MQTTWSLPAWGLLLAALARLGWNAEPRLTRSNRERPRCATTLWERLQPRRGLASCRNVTGYRGLASRLQAAPTR